MAKRTMSRGTQGRIAFDYDMRIAEPFAAGDVSATGDLWPAWLALAGKPVLVLRGENSDILAAATAHLMVCAVESAGLVTLPRIGHAPTLEEPEALAVIRRLLAKVT
jgi:pimeloyl-ACP methyl ester carboxylesterase